MHLLPFLAGKEIGVANKKLLDGYKLLRKEKRRERVRKKYEIAMYVRKLKAKFACT